MKNKIIWILLFVSIFSGGAFFRLWRLKDRPMHTDEAVHAEKFGILLEEGLYHYDPDEFHGSTLNYFTLISTWLRGEKSYTHINEVTIRLVPAVFGIGLVLTPLFFKKELGVRAVLFSCILLSFSPAFTYYSRYYIQEMLLLFFTAVFLGSVWRYFHSRKCIWVIVSGISIGLMHASKETFVFSVAAAVLALTIGVLIQDGRWFIKIPHLLFALAVMMITSILFYSSFGANPEGILDSITTYSIWAKRASGQSVHIHPWYYYLNLLMWLAFIEPITWNENGIVALALIGSILAFFKKGGRRYHLGRFLAIYTVILMVIYSSIPYKTPWSMMGFVYGMALLAGFAADRIIRHAHGLWTKYIFWAILFIYGLASPLLQSWMLNFNYPSGPINPYVYAHTGTDIYTMIDSIENAANASKERRNTPIHVIADGDDYWPLPWYLRNFSQVGYWNHVDDSAYRIPIIVANAACEKKLLHILYTIPQQGHRHLYVPLFDGTLEMRPGVQWRGYIRKDLWDQMHSE